MLESPLLGRLKRTQRQPGALDYVVGLPLKCLCSVVEKGVRYSLPLKPLRWNQDLKQKSEVVVIFKFRVQGPCPLFLLPPISLNTRDSGKKLGGRGRKQIFSVSKTKAKPAYRLIRVVPNQLQVKSVLYLYLFSSGKYC